MHMKNPWPEHVAPTVHHDEYFCYTCAEVHKKDDPCACEVSYRQLDEMFERDAIHDRKRKE